MVKNKHKQSPIFYDNSKRRWKVLKIAGFLFSIVIVVLFALISYSYLYSPFTESESNTRYVDRSITDINNKIIPLRGSGSMLKLEETRTNTVLEKVGIDKKVAVLTFDDGPDSKFTPLILDVLKKENVPGSFFVTGEQLYKHNEIAEEIINQGSDIGLHTFSHYENVKDVKLNSLSFIFEMDFTQKVFAHYFGYKSNIFRVPFLGSEVSPSYNSLQYIGEGLKRDMVVSVPSVDSNDWEPGISKEEIVKYATAPESDNAVILFHDAGGNRMATVQALSEVIKYYKAEGYEFMTVSALAEAAGFVAREELTFTDKLLSHTAFFVYDIYKSAPQFIGNGFLVGFGFVILHSVLFVILALIHKLKSVVRKHKLISSKALISVIIPMHNEEKAIIGSIKAILKSTHKNFELIIVDDGSTDKSYQVVRRLIRDARVRIISQPNLGKFTALNTGLYQAKGKITIFVDGDTKLAPNAIERIISRFNEAKVGAVAGNIRVGNEKHNALTLLQSIEYNVNQGIEKRVYDLFDSVLVVPGAFGAWRTRLVKKFGGFTDKTHAEDFDLTMEFIRHGYKVKFDDSAIAYTEAPTVLKELIKQRLRWNFGNLQVLFKNSDMLFNVKFGILGLFFLPRYVLLQIPSIAITPAVDVITVASIIVGNQFLIMLFILLYLIIQVITTYIAHIFTNSSLRRPHYIFFIRLPYTQIMYASFFMAMFQALKGEIFAWKKLNHNGFVSS